MRLYLDNLRLLVFIGLDQRRVRLLRVVNAHLAAAGVRRREVLVPQYVFDENHVRSWVIDLLQEGRLAGWVHLWLLRVLLHRLSVDLLERWQLGRLVRIQSRRVSLRFLRRLPSVVLSSLTMPLLLCLKGFCVLTALAEIGGATRYILLRCAVDKKVLSMLHHAHAHLFKVLKRHF